jgi:hypothetical protein
LHEEEGKTYLITASGLEMSVSQLEEKEEEEIINSRPKNGG